MGLGSRLAAMFAMLAGASNPVMHPRHVRVAPQTNDSILRQLMRPESQPKLGKGPGARRRARSHVGARRHRAKQRWA